LKDIDLPLDTRLTISFEDTEAAVEVLKRKKAIDAMSKLKGSGSGKLVAVLLEERRKDKLL
jgi:hypothetical protein